MLNTLQFNTSVPTPYVFHEEVPQGCSIRQEGWFWFSFWFCLFNESTNIDWLTEILYLNLNHDPDGATIILLDGCLPGGV